MSLLGSTWERMSVCLLNFYDGTGLSAERLYYNVPTRHASCRLQSITGLTADLWRLQLFMSESVIPVLPSLSCSLEVSSP